MLSLDSDDMKQAVGTMCISLDFELHWGIRDNFQVEDCKEILLGARVAIPRMLELFEEYKIRATWATVGFLFCETRDELLSYIPRALPHYTNPNLSPYNMLHEIGENEEADPYHFAPSLIRLIGSYPDQEIGSHTFSHYYSLEPGQDAAAFRADILAAQRIASHAGYTLKSLVFPRNGIAQAYISICEEVGFTSYRGTQGWMYQYGGGPVVNNFRRAARLLSAYIGTSSHDCFSLSDVQQGTPRNVIGSAFLRPPTATAGTLETLRIRRILDSLTHAAQRGLIYHLWWHPHNFGGNIEKNLSVLRTILEHFAWLRNRYGFSSRHMADIAGIADR